MKGGYKGKNKSWQKKGTQSNHMKAKGSNVTDCFYIYNKWINLSGTEKDQVRQLWNERDKKRNVQAVTFALTPIIHYYNPMASAADLPPPVSTPPMGVGAVMSQQTTMKPAPNNRTL
jgi:hypothetical protein